MSRRISPNRAIDIEKTTRAYMSLPAGCRERGGVVGDLARRWGVSKSWARRLVARTVPTLVEWDAAIADGLIQPRSA